MNATPTLNRSTLADPAALYAELRAVGVTRDAHHGFWLVARHADVVDSLRRPEVFSSEVGPLAHLRGGTDTAMMIAADDPRHHRLRSVVSDVFHRRRTEAWREPMTAVADELLDGALDARVVDAVAAFAVPLPVRVIATLLGIPTSDEAQFRSWSHTFIDGLSHRDPATAVAPAWTALTRYLGEAIDVRRSHPADDLISSVAARIGDEQLALSPDEAVDLCVLLLVAGNETTTNLLANAIGLLADRPALQAELREAPGGIGRFVEEVLRYDSPVQGLFRRCTQPTSLGGVRIDTGDLVVLLFGSANRDEQVFDAADELQPGREASPHVAFGLGPHYCLGASLARLEAQIGLERLLARTKRIEPAPRAEPSRAVSLVTRGYDRLPVVLGPKESDDA